MPTDDGSSNTKVIWKPRFKRGFDDLTPQLQRKARKAIRLVQEDPSNRGLGLKRYRSIPGMWEARVNRYYRIYLEMDAAEITLISIRHHGQNP